MKKIFIGVVGFLAVSLSAEPYLVLEVEGENKGVIEINLRADLAPKHVARIIELTNSKAYDGIVFHRVIDGFMAQTGDVEFGKLGGDLSHAGSGGSKLGNVPAEFTPTTFAKGVVGMARSSEPDSANSQFFIMFAPMPSLDNQYTVFGEVVVGQEVVDMIKKGDSNNNGTIVGAPDYIKSARIEEKSSAK